MDTHGLVPGQQLAAQLTSAFSGAPGAGDRPWLWQPLLRLLARGEPVAACQLAGATGRPRPRRRIRHHAQPHSAPLRGRRPPAVHLVRAGHPDLPRRPRQARPRHLPVPHHRHPRTADGRAGQSHRRTARHRGPVHRHPRRRHLNSLRVLRPSPLLRHPPRRPAVARPAPRRHRPARPRRLPAWPPPHPGPPRRRPPLLLLLTAHDEVPLCRRANLEASGHAGVLEAVAAGAGGDPGAEGEQGGERG